MRVCECDLRAVAYPSYALSWKLSSWPVQSELRTEYNKSTYISGLSSINQKIVELTGPLECGARIASMRIPPE
jgi:hypothetical protein